jgi:hypothetical protein
LINAVLDALPTFAMGALELPPGVITALDRLRRSFLWAATDRVTGAKCLVAWEWVCRSKEEGGLGIRSLSVQNGCLLTKLLHRLHCAQDESWPRWVWGCLDGLPLDDAARSTSLSGTHWASLLRLLPLYRAICRVKIGDGKRTSFWRDHWLSLDILESVMPAARILPRQFVTSWTLALIRRWWHISQRRLPARGRCSFPFCRAWCSLTASTLVPSRSVLEVSA